MFKIGNFESDIKLKKFLFNFVFNKKFMLVEILAKFICDINFSGDRFRPIMRVSKENMLSLVEKIHLKSVGNCEEAKFDESFEMANLKSMSINKIQLSIYQI
jgi:hypothetical protein